MGHKNRGLATDEKGRTLPCTSCLRAVKASPTNCS